MLRQIAKKAELKVKFATQPEVVGRFYELTIKRVEDYGAKLHLNLDSLRETKCDPRVGSIILQEMHMLQDIVLFSDFCGPREIDTFFHRVYNLGRPDPSLQEKTSSKKPSHSNTDMYNFMNGLRKNLVA